MKSKDELQDWSRYHKIEKHPLSPFPTLSVIKNGLFLQCSNITYHAVCFLKKKIICEEIIE